MPSLFVSFLFVVEESEEAVREAAAYAYPTEKSEATVVVVSLLVHDEKVECFVDDDQGDHLDQHANFGVEFEHVDLRAVRGVEQG